MSLTNEDFDKLVFTITEKVLLRMPEVIGNLMKNHAEINKLTKGFYEKYPDFKTDPLSVQSVTNQIEKDNPGLVYDEILKQAAPLIKERMSTVKKADIKNIKEKSNLDLNISVDLANGEF